MAALRRRIAIVTQDVDLFRAPLRDNLTLFGTHAAGDAELQDLLGRIGLGAWVASLPDGLDTVLEGGQGLLGGRGPARRLRPAFLADPDIVVLDEASSRLDPFTEDASPRPPAGCSPGGPPWSSPTGWRPWPEVDEIAVLENGRLVEHGDRRRLAADDDSRYARLLRTAKHGLFPSDAGSAALPPPAACARPRHTEEATA